jgi:hypothetical protein
MTRDVAKIGPADGGGHAAVVAGTGRAHRTPYVHRSHGVRLGSSVAAVARPCDKRRPRMHARRS